GSEPAGTACAHPESACEAGRLLQDQDEDQGQAGRASRAGAAHRVRDD
ncbi:MAG: hypothetical protein AVDCRST_MAG23-1032, partial [uncultured Sphingosinicella sp.]